MSTTSTIQPRFGGVHFILDPSMGILRGAERYDRYQRWVNYYQDKLDAIQGDYQVRVRSENIVCNTLAGIDRYIYCTDRFEISNVLTPGIVDTFNGSYIDNNVLYKRTVKDCFKKIIRIIREAERGQD